MPPIEAYTGSLADTVIDNIPEDLSFTTLGAADLLRADALLADQDQRATAAAELGNPDVPAAAKPSAARDFQRYLQEVLAAHYAKTTGESPTNIGKFASAVPPQAAKACGA